MRNYSEKTQCDSKWHVHSSSTLNAIHLKPFTVCVTVQHQKLCTDIHIHMTTCTQSNIKRVWIHNNHKEKTEGGRYQKFTALRLSLMQATNVQYSLFVFNRVCVDSVTSENIVTVTLMNMNTTPQHSPLADYSFNRLPPPSVRLTYS